MASASAKVTPEKVVAVDPKNIKPHPDNERIYGDIPSAILVQDIREHGVIQPLVCDKKTKEVISGRRRHAAALRAGLTEVPVIWRSYTDNNAMVEAIVLHNTYRQKTDRQILLEVEALARVEKLRAQERKDEGSKKGGIASRGTPKSQGKELTGDRNVAVLEPILDPSIPAGVKGVRVRKKRSSARTTSGEVGNAVGRSARTVEKAMSVINDAKKRHGDNWTEAPEVKAVLTGKATINKASQNITTRKREKEFKEKAKAFDVAELDVRHSSSIEDIDNESIDHVIVDPPYGVATGFIATFKDRSDMSSTFGDWDSGELLLGEIEDWISEWDRVMKTGGNIAVFCADTYLSFVKAILKNHGFNGITTIVWHKSNPEPVVRQTNFVSSCEYIVTAFKGPKRNTFHWKGQNEMHNVVRGAICAGKERMNHPTQKPLWLMSWLIERLTDPGDVVLDNFAGVGSTGEACKNAKRNFILVESKEEYVIKIQARLG